MKENKTVRFVAFTAVGIAMAVAAQWLGSMLPAGAVIAGPFAVKQLVTGSLVNCILFVFADRVSLGSAVTVGVFSAVLASVIGVGPQVLPLVPLIAAGNALLAVIYCLAKNRLKLTGILRILLAAAVKCGFLWLTVPALLSALTSVPGKQAKALSVMFSWPQGLTALIGGILALAVIPRLKKTN